MYHGLVPEEAIRPNPKFTHLYLTCASYINCHPITLGLQGNFQKIFLFYYRSFKAGRYLVSMKIQALVSYGQVLLSFKKLGLVISKGLPVVPLFIDYDILTYFVETNMPGKNTKLPWNFVSKFIKFLQRSKSFRFRKNIGLLFVE